MSIVVLADRRYGASTDAAHHLNPAGTLGPSGTLFSKSKAANLQRDPRKWPKRAVQGNACKQARWFF